MTFIIRLIAQEQAASMHLAATLSFKKGSCKGGEVNFYQMVLSIYVSAALAQLYLYLLQRLCLWFRDCTGGALVHCNQCWPFCLLNKWQLAAFAVFPFRKHLLRCLSVMKHVSSQQRRTTWSALTSEWFNVLIRCISNSKWDLEGTGHGNHTGFASKHTSKQWSSFQHSITSRITK